MTLRDTSAIQTWHAHVYFDSATRDSAWAFGEQIEARWHGKLQMGRFHERPVGPHPMWSYQIAFAHEQFGDLIGWLTLNHGALDILCTRIPRTRCAITVTPPCGSAAHTSSSSAR
jgi:DOPA 4,5-dioxygenase